MTGRPRRHLALVLGAAVLVSSCGVPRDTEVAVVEDDTVPYRLLEPAGPSSDSGPEAPAAGPEPSLFWLRDDRLVPSPSEASCADDPLDAAREVLDALAAGPPEAERADGRSTAIPPGSSLSVVALDDGTAVVQLDDVAGVSADRLPVAVGQVALSLTSSPGVDSIVLVTDGEAVPAPLPGGALTEEPVGATDYLGLVPTALRRAAAGCPG